MDATQSTQVKPSALGQSAVIVGAGPAGALTAVSLAQLGWKVSVFESRQAELEASPRRRSYNIVLNNRGLKALKTVDVELTDAERILLTGNVRHKAQGASVSQGFANSVSIDRYRLAQVLIQKGQTCFPEQIAYSFQHTLE